MHFADAQRFYCEIRFTGTECTLGSINHWGPSMVWWGWKMWFFCSIFATSAHLQINRATSSAFCLLLQIPIQSTIPLSVVCMTVEISRRWSLLGGVSSGRVSLHTNWWGQIPPRIRSNAQYPVGFPFSKLSFYFEKKTSFDLLDFIFRGAEAFQVT